MTKFKAPARLVVVQFAHCVQFVQSEHFLRSEIRGITGSDFLNKDMDINNIILKCRNVYFKSDR